jgi:hypothetical protein
VAARRGLRGPIIHLLNYLIATSRFTSSVRARGRIAARDILHNGWYGSCVKLFFCFCLTPAFHACYKEAGAIHIGVRRHTNRKDSSAAAFDA